MKQIFISCDMEEIPGICSNREIGGIFYEWERKVMTHELNTVIKFFIKKEDLRNE